MTLSVSDFFFAVVAMAAAACFGVLIYLQVTEEDFYENPAAPYGGTIWATTSQTGSR